MKRNIRAEIPAKFDSKQSVMVSTGHGHIDMLGDSTCIYFPVTLVAMTLFGIWSAITLSFKPYLLETGIM